MKAKRSIVLISTLVAGIVLAPAVFAEEAEPFESDFSKLTTINVSCGGWDGSFAPNGTAKLQRHNANIEFWERVDAPVGSFSFEEICALVAYHLKFEPVPNPKECLSMTFLFDPPDARGVPPFLFSYIEDKQVIRTLMHGLREKALPRDKTTKTYFEELYSKYPLVPGEKPAPFRYDSNKGTMAVIIILIVVVCVGAILWFIRKRKKNVQ